MHVVEPSERPRSFAAATALLSREVSTPWLAIGNVDATLDPGALAQLLTTGAQDPRVAVVVPRILGPDGRADPVARAFPGVRQAMLQASHLGRRLGGTEALPWAWDPDRSRPVPWAFASFLLVRRAALSAIGGWTADLPEHALELDLCWRLSLGGWSVRYDSAAVVRRQDGAVPRAAFGEPHRALDAHAEWNFLRRRRGVVVAGTVAAIATGHSALRAAVWSAVVPRGARAARARGDLRAKREALAASAAPEQTGRPKVAYFVSRFPEPTQTFIVRELDAVAAHGFDIVVMTTFPPNSGPSIQQRPGGRRTSVTAAWQRSCGRWPGGASGGR